MIKTMELNKETANRLWVKQFGKRQKAFDFAGREIAKASYNDRNSDFGWNVDHILPESKGGKTADHNLICCSIKTNDEKADRFPAFKANGKLFEIQRRQNHYEILPKSPNVRNEFNEKSAVNFYDVAQGVEYWKQCKSEDNEVFIAYSKIQLRVSNGSPSAINRFRAFIKELFDTDSIYESHVTYSNSSFVTFTVVNFDVPLKEDSEEWLNRCILLNTYRHYLIAQTAIEEIHILCGLCNYDSETNMRSNIYNDIINQQVQLTENLVINESIKINTSAEKKLKDIESSTLGLCSSAPYGCYPYNIVFTKLNDNLQKYI